MSKGTQLIADADGHLTNTEKGSFGAGRKKKIKAALSGAAKTLGALVETIADADDEESFMKRIAAVAGALGGMGGKPKDDSEGGSKKSDDGEEDSKTVVSTEGLDAMETDLLDALKSDAPTPAPSEATRENAAKLDAMQGQLDSLTKATHTLVSVVKSTSGGGRPRTNAASAGETPPVQKSDSEVWSLDMNSSDLDPDEQFI